MRMMRVNPGAKAVSFNEAAGTDPADASRPERRTRRLVSFNEAAGTDPADALIGGLRDTFSPALQ